MLSVLITNDGKTSLLLAYISPVVSFHIQSLNSLWQVPQSIDQSEDEGFQSASNLTPDSQSEPSMTPDIDLWDAVLTYGPSKRRCWERIG